MFIIEGFSIQFCVILALFIFGQFVIHTFLIEVEK